VTDMNAEASVKCSLWNIHVSDVW